MDKLLLEVNKNEVGILIRALSWATNISPAEKRMVIEPLINQLKYCNQCRQNNFKHQCSNISCQNSYEEIQI